MRIFYICAAAAALAATASTASAQTAPSTGRPSYDMPRAYDRNGNGDETYRYRDFPGQVRRDKQRKHEKHYDD